MAPLLEVKDLRKSFGNVRALDGAFMCGEGKKVNILKVPTAMAKTALINAVSLNTGDAPA